MIVGTLKEGVGRKEFGIFGKARISWRFYCRKKSKNIKSRQPKK